MLADSAIMTMNLMAANFFANLAFPGGSSLSPDGQSIFSAAHPGVGTLTQSNLGTSPISYLALEDAIQQIKGQKGDRGLPRYNMGGWDLICTTANEGATTRAVNSKQIAGTNANDTAEFVSGRINRITADPFIGIDDATLLDIWMLVPSAKDENPFAYLSAESVRTTGWYDGESDVTKFSAHMEGVMMTSGWMGTFGSNP